MNEKDKYVMTKEEHFKLHSAGWFGQLIYKIKWWFMRWFKMINEKEFLKAMIDDIENHLQALYRRLKNLEKENETNNK